MNKKKLSSKENNRRQFNKGYETAKIAYIALTTVAMYNCSEGYISDEDILAYAYKVQEEVTRLLEEEFKSDLDAVTVLAHKVTEMLKKGEQDVRDKK